MIEIIRLVFSGRKYGGSAQLEALSVNQIKIQESTDIEYLGRYISRMSFEPIRDSIDQSMSLGRKDIGYKTRTISEPIYEYELVNNLAMQICYEVANTNPNSIAF